MTAVLSPARARPIATLGAEPAICDSTSFTRIFPPYSMQSWHSGILSWHWRLASLSTTKVSSLISPIVIMSSIEKKKEERIKKEGKDTLTNLPFFDEGKQKPDRHESPHGSGLVR